MKINFTQAVLASFLSIIIIGVGVKVYKNNGPSEYDDFAQCLTNNGAIMYGADWCHNCQAQKKMFGNAFKKYIDYVQCDITPDACEAENVKGYPTWKKHIEGSSILVGRGVQPLDKLAEAFNCELPKSN